MGARLNPPLGARLPHPPPSAAGVPRVMSVSTNPGATRFTRTPRGPSSRARLLVKPDRGL